MFYTSHCDFHASQNALFCYPFRSAAEDAVEAISGLASTTLLSPAAAQSEARFRVETEVAIESVGAWRHEWPFRICSFLESVPFTIVIRIQSASSARFVRL